MEKRQTRLSVTFQLISGLKTQCLLRNEKFNLQRCNFHTAQLRIDFCSAIFLFLFFKLSFRIQMLNTSWLSTAHGQSHCLKSKSLGLWVAGFFRGGPGFNIFYGINTIMEQNWSFLLSGKGFGKNLMKVRCISII